jgi:hypothetical protein
LQHLQEETACRRLDRGWMPVFPPKMRQRKNASARSRKVADFSHKIIATDA